MIAVIDMHQHRVTRAFRNQPAAYIGSKSIQVWQCRVRDNVFNQMKRAPGACIGKGMIWFFV